MISPSPSTPSVVVRLPRRALGRPGIATDRAARIGS